VRAPLGSSPSTSRSPESSAARRTKVSENPLTAPVLQMSPNTDPASTEANWSRSPKRISRVSWRRASTSLAMSGKETMEASSTMITS